MAYADYTYYSETYLGTAIAEADYDRLALRASEYIDRITFGRAAEDEDYTDEIKKAACAIAEVLNEIENDGASGVQSEKVGSHAVTYAQNSTKLQTTNQRVIEAANLYLASSGLLYRGFATGEYGSR